MIMRDDLRAAVAAGIMTEAQAASLASLADARRGARENLAAGDEPFELFKGFNEIFIVVGLGILAAGWPGASVARPDPQRQQPLAGAGSGRWWFLGHVAGPPGAGVCGDCKV